MKDLDEFIARCEANSIPDDKIDTSDCPVLTPEQLAQMKPCHLINRQKLLNTNLSHFEAIATLKSSAGTLPEDFDAEQERDSYFAEKYGES